jgi:hypothetical protein
MIQSDFKVKSITGNSGIQTLSQVTSSKHKIGCIHIITKWNLKILVVVNYWGNVVVYTGKGVIYWKLKRN